MSLHRRAAKRDANEPQIVAAFRMLGWSVERLSIPGGPDLLVGKSKRTHLVEVKTETGKVKAAQTEWHEGWRGSPVRVVRNVDDVSEIDAAEAWDSLNRMTR